MNSQRAHSQRGQAFLIIVIFVGVFLLAVMGIATDYAQIWAHRQIAQGAADAACQAGAADLLLYFEDFTSTYSTANAAWIGTAYNCSAHTTSSPCKYAAQNGGYTGSNVSVTFPSSLPNAPALPRKIFDRKPLYPGKHHRCSTDVFHEIGFFHPYRKRHH